MVMMMISNCISHGMWVAAACGAYAQFDALFDERVHARRADLLLVLRVGVPAGICPAPVINQVENCSTRQRQTEQTVY
jgi:hypothetical protein